MAHVAPGGSIRGGGFVAGTTGSGQPLNARGVLNLTVYLTASAALSDGVVTVEEASWDPGSQVPYGGTWSLIKTYTLSSVFASTGGQYADHLQQAAYANVRLRISTTVVGGTVAGVIEGA